MFRRFVAIIVFVTATLSEHTQSAFQVGLDVKFNESSRVNITYDLEPRSPVSNDKKKRYVNGPWSPHDPWLANQPKPPAHDPPRPKDTVTTVFKTVSETRTITATKTVRYDHTDTRTLKVPTTVWSTKTETTIKRIVSTVPTTVWSAKTETRIKRIVSTVPTTVWSTKTEPTTKVITSTTTASFQCGNSITTEPARVSTIPTTVWLTETETTTSITTSTTIASFECGNSNKTEPAIVSTLPTTVWNTETETETTTTTSTTTETFHHTVTVNVSSRVSTAPWTGSYTTTNTITGADGQETVIVNVPSRVSTAPWTGSYTTTNTITGADGQETVIVSAPFGNVTMEEVTYSGSDFISSSIASQEMGYVSSTVLPMISYSTLSELLRTSTKSVGDLTDEMTNYSITENTSLMNPSISSLSGPVRNDGDRNEPYTISDQAYQHSTKSFASAAASTPVKSMTEKSSSHDKSAPSAIIVVPEDPSFESDLSASSIEDANPTLGSFVCVGESSCSDAPPVDFSTSEFSFATESGPIPGKSKGFSTGSAVPESQDGSPLSSADNTPPAAASSSISVEFENAASSSKAKFAVLLISVVALAV